MKETGNGFVKDLIIDIILAVIIAGVVLFFVRPTIVHQTSMVPTFQDGDYVFVYKRAYVHKNPQRGDVIVFQSDLEGEEETGIRGAINSLFGGNSDKLLIKRVIGLPGDTITIEDGMVYINDKEYDEDYLNDGYTTGEVDNYTVPENCYYCMGDNRVVSIDSRYPEVGPVSKDSIMGKVVLRLYPFNRIKTF